MSQYNPVTPTIHGQAMIAESLKTETGLVFTKVEWGDGIVSSGEQYPTFTALKNKVIESPISKMERQDATLYITSVVNNSTLSTGFYCREIGVWAKIGANGTEQLFAYTYAENASYTPSSDQYNEKRIRIGLGVDADVNVTIKFNSEVYLTRQELEDHDADSAAHDAAFMAHNTNPTAHPDIRQTLNSYASNITALQASDNAKFKAVSASNDTLTFTKGDNTTTAVTVNNVANATKATNDGNGANIADTYIKKAGDTVTGTLNVPTQATTDNSTKVANTAFVQSVVSQLVNSAPATLDTLNELANALGNDSNFATTVSTQIGQKADRTELNNNLALHNTDANAHKNIIDTVPIISILTGTCIDGETIPLPDGYTESQCKIFVSMMKENPDGYWFDVAESGAKNMLRTDCYADGRILRCAMITNGYDGWRTGLNSGPNVGPRIACVANYMVIGIKYGG